MNKVARVLGLDFGQYKTGVAIGQTLTATASPLGIIKKHLSDFSADDLQPYIKQWSPVAIVIGRPYLADGKPHPLDEGIDRAAKQLEMAFTLPLFYISEYLSSHEAKKRVKKNKKQLDDMAAAVILETWLSHSADALYANGSELDL